MKEIILSSCLSRAWERIRFSLYEIKGYKLFFTLFPERELNITMLNTASKSMSDLVSPVNELNVMLDKITLKNAHKEIKICSNFNERN